ncbi:hypothetical protein, partial [Terrabacter aerolatus]
MNLTDLRDELAAHADDVGPAPDLRAGVAQRVRTTRLRRAAAGGSLATLTVAALTVGVLTSTGLPTRTVPGRTAPADTPSVAMAPMVGSDGMPYRTVPDSPGDVVKDGLRYRGRVADDRLVAGVIGDPGRSTLTFTWTPSTTRASLAAACWIPGADAATAEHTMVMLSVQGRLVMGSGCGTARPEGRDLPTGGAIPGGPGGGWDAITVGRPVTATLRLVDRDTKAAVTDPSVRLTGAVYEQGLQQPIEDAAGTTVAELPTVVEHQGYRYRLAGVATGPLASGPLPELGVETSPYAAVAVPVGPFLLAWGSAGTDLPGTGRSGDGAQLRLEGLRDAEARGYDSWGVVPVPAGSIRVSADSTRSLRLVADGA